jgi:type IV secretory pathway VirB4 component
LPGTCLPRRKADGADSQLWAVDEPEGAGADFTVLDIYDLKDAEESVRRAQHFNILSYAWNMVKRDRAQKIILVVDEAWLLADPQTPQSLAFLRDTSKRIRKYMGSLVVISQNVIDFLAPEIQRHGQTILDNPTYKLLLAQGEIEAKNPIFLIEELRKAFIRLRNDNGYDGEIFSNTVRS